MQNFPPFPLRARGSLEIFDAAIKLYKQYFWVLIGWSAIVSGVGIIGSMIPFVGFFVTLFLTPLAVGSVVCCIAAAVRGQRVEFGQCWRFTQPRYWMLMLMHIITWIVAVAVLSVLIAICAGIVVAGAFAFQASTLAVQIAMGVLAFLILGTIATILGTVFVAWMGLVPIVVCMEEDKRGTASLGRALEILRGHWLRITMLMAIVGLATLTLFAILAGAAAVVVGVGQISDLLQGRGGTTALWLGIAAMGLAYLVLAIICTPLSYLILSIFYLDVRVRQEALDLEWTAHATAPIASAETIAPTFIQTPLIPGAEYSMPGMPTQSQPIAPGNLSTRRLSDDANYSAPPDAFEPQRSTPAPDISTEPSRDA